MDASSGGQDAPTVPYDGPSGQFAYGSPNGSSGLPGVLSSVQIVTVTWGSDTESLVSQIAMAFNANLGGTPWWSALSSYCEPGTNVCVGKTVSVTATHVGDPPGLPYVDSAVMQNAKDSFPRFVNDKSKPGIGGKPADLPTPVTASTLFVFFLPQSLPATSQAPALPEGYAVTVDGASSCGYHSATVVGTTDVAYAVIPRCSVAGQSDANVAMATAFREVADAVTDPFRAEGRIGYTNPSSMAKFEVGDFCPGTTTVGGFNVPQIWDQRTTTCGP
jgi:hypothetical protein